MKRFEIHPNAISTEISEKEIRIRMAEIPQELMSQRLAEKNFAKLCEICIDPGQIEQFVRALINAAVICNNEYGVDFDFLRSKGGDDDGEK